MHYGPQEDESECESDFGKTRVGVWVWAVGEQAQNRAEIFLFSSCGYFVL